MATIFSPPPVSTDDSNRYLEDVLPEEASASATKVWIAVVFLAAAVAFWLGIYVQKFSTKPAPVGPFEGEASSAQSSLVVHVAGHVNKPGVYAFPFDARVRDAVQKAGGPKPKADLNAINLAAWLEDGSKIEVPLKSAAAPSPAFITESTPLQSTQSASTSPTPSTSEENFIAAPEPQNTPLPPSHISKGKTRTSAKAKAPKVLPEVPREKTKAGEESQNASPEYLAKHQININTATAEQLELLPGIGSSTAQKIVDYRQQNGAFKSVDDLDNVSGIGEKTLEKLRPLVTVQ